MSDIVLFYPSTGLDVGRLSLWLPLPLLHVAAPLVPDFEVTIVDQRLGDDWPDKLRAAIKDRTLCLGITSMTGAQIRGGLAAAAVARATRPELPIVWGGVHPTLAPESTLRHPLVDIVVMGEGERKFRLLVEAMAAKRDWRDIAGLGYKQGGDIFKNGTGTEPERFLDPATLPPLPYHLVDVERHISGPLIFGRPLRALPYLSAFGCPWKCAFCCQPVLSRGRWRRQPPELVLERTLALKEKYRLDAIEFHDEEFFVDRKRGEKLAAMIGGQYEWYVQTRMDDLLHLDLAQLERNGLRVVHPGIETGSPRMLELIRKDETVETFLAANRKLAKTSIAPTYNFMMGYPDETPEDLAATIDLALRLVEEHPRAYVSGFYVYVPYPGASLFDRAVRDGFAAPETLEGWAAFNRQHLLTPWLKGREDEFEMLMFSSKFIDGQRWGRSFPGAPLIPSLNAALGAWYRRRWRKRDFRLTPEIRFMSWGTRRALKW